MIVAPSAVISLTVAGYCCVLSISVSSITVFTSTPQFLAVRSVPSTFNCTFPPSLSISVGLTVIPVTVPSFASSFPATVTVVSFHSASSASSLVAAFTVYTTSFVVVFSGNVIKNPCLNTVVIPFGNSGVIVVSSTPFLNTFTAGLPFGKLLIFSPSTANSACPPSLSKLALSTVNPLIIAGSVSSANTLTVQDLKILYKLPSG